METFTEVTELRFWCREHEELLQNCGNGRLFSPTCSPEPDVDEKGWLYLDTSELHCNSCSQMIHSGLEPQQDWVIQAK